MTISIARSTASAAGLFAEVLQHHRAGPDLAHRVRDALPAMSGADPCTGSNIDG